MRDYVADRRQYLDSGKRSTSGGWMVMWWDDKRQIHVEGSTHTTKAEAAAVIREARARSAAAAALGSKGGSAGRGESKRRGNTDHYREMAQRSAAARRKRE